MSIELLSTPALPGTHEAQMRIFEIRSILPPRNQDGARNNLSGSTGLVGRGMGLRRQVVIDRGGRNAVVSTYYRNCKFPGTNPARLENIPTS